MLALIVSDFQREIVAVAKAESRGLGGFPQVSQLLVVAGFFAGIVYMISNPEWIGNPLYHGLGLAIALASVLVVRYVIDPRIVVCSMDERFSEYGLLSSFRYESVFLRRSVGRWGWMLNVKPAAKILFSGILPPYGISILVMMPFEYLESRKTIRIMKRSYDVGGEVGMMINAGRTEDEIRVYLSSRIIAKNRVRRWSGKNPSGARENAVTHTPSAYENESADCRSD